MPEESSSASPPGTVRDAGWGRVKPTLDQGSRLPSFLETPEKRRLQQEDGTLSAIAVNHREWVKQSLSIPPGGCRVRGRKPFLLVPSRRWLWPGGEITYTRHGSFQQLEEPQHEPRAFTKPASERKQREQFKVVWQTEKKRR